MSGLVFLADCLAVFLGLAISGGVFQGFMYSKCPFRLVFLFSLSCWPKVGSAWQQAGYAVTRNDVETVAVAGVFVFSSCQANRDTHPVASAAPGFFPVDF